MWMKILNFLRGVLAPIAFLVVLAGLVFFLGPRWHIVKPWNFLLAGFLLLLAVLVYWIWWLTKRQRERQFESEMERQAKDDMARASVARRAEMESLNARWKESLQQFRQASLRGKNALQKLPWFVILGESQCGKSTLLRNSGLDFPIGDAKVHGMGGTKNCDWWFANEAIILDTAGRYAFEVQSAPDREEWDGFLGLLRKTRRKSPVSGLLVTVPADSLLRKGEEDLEAYGQHLRGKINDLMTRLGVVFPVYLVVTKADLVEGFFSFFEKYPADRVREAVGRTFADVRPASCIGTAYKTMDDLYDRLCSMSLGLMAQYVDTGAAAQPYLLHPEEFRTLTAKLKIFVEALFRENIYMRNPIFRGLYLTSGTQEGRTIASAFLQAAANLGIQTDVLTTLYAAETPKRAYFVKDLLSKILIEDARRDLVRPLALAARQQLLRALYRVMLPAAAVGAVFLIWAGLAYTANRGDWRELESAVESARLRAGAATDTATAAARLDKVRDAHEQATDHSSFLSLGMARKGPADEFESAFRGAVERQVLVPVLGRVKRDLEGGQLALPTYVQELASYAAYRRALKTPDAVKEVSRLAGLVASDQTLCARKAEVANLAMAYANLHGTYDGNVDFQQVARGMGLLMARIGSTDPVSHLRSISQRAGPVVAGRGGEQELSELWGELRGVAVGNAADIGLSAEFLDAVERDLSDIPEARRSVLGPFQALRTGAPATAAPSGQMGKAGVFVQQVQDPLRRAAGVNLPSCAPPAPPDATAVNEASTALKAFHDDVAKLADSVKEGVKALNSRLASVEQIDGQAVRDLLIRGRMAEAYRSCTASWFDAEGPLNPKGLSDSSSAATAAEPIGPSGDVLFKCDVAVAPAGGGGASAAVKEKTDPLRGPLAQLWKSAGQDRAGQIHRWVDPRGREIEDRWGPQFAGEHHRQDPEGAPGFGTIDRGVQSVLSRLVLGCDSRDRQATRRSAQQLPEGSRSGQAGAGCFSLRACERRRRQGSGQPPAQRPAEYSRFRPRKDRRPGRLERDATEVRGVPFRLPVPGRGRGRRLRSVQDGVLREGTRSSQGDPGPRAEDAEVPAGRQCDQTGDRRGQACEAEREAPQDRGRDQRECLRKQGTDRGEGCHLDAERQALDGKRRRRDDRPGPSGGRVEQGRGQRLGSGPRRHLPSDVQEAVQEGRPRAGSEAEAIQRPLVLPETAPVGAAGRGRRHVHLFVEGCGDRRRFADTDRQDRAVLRGDVAGPERCFLEARPAGDQQGLREQEPRRRVATMGTTVASVHAYGKLPVTGDFIHYRLDGEEAMGFASWVEKGQALVQAIRKSGAEPADPDTAQWRRYRFVFDPGGGRRLLVGVLRDSHDRDRLRRFPFAIFVEVDRSIFRDRPALTPMLLHGTCEAIDEGMGAAENAASMDDLHARLSRTLVEVPDPSSRTTRDLDVLLEESPAGKFWEGVFPKGGMEKRLVLFDLLHRALAPFSSLRGEEVPASFKLPLAGDAAETRLQCTFWVELLSGMARAAGRQIPSLFAETPWAGGCLRSLQLFFRRGDEKNFASLLARSHEAEYVNDLTDPPVSMAASLILDAPRRRMVENDAASLFDLAHFRWLG
jgi:type VI secretion system ImpM family protein